MTTEVNNIGWGYQDDNDESLQGGTIAGKFGLNVGNITKFAFNPNAGKDGAVADALDMTILIDGKEFLYRVFPVTKIYKGGNELDSSDPDYPALYKKEMSQLQGTLTHLIKATGVTDQQLRQAFVTPVQSFAEYIQRLCSLLPANFSNNTVDVFLQYQWTLKEGAKMTYLEIPKNLKSGKFIVPHIEPKGGAWQEKRDHTGLSYVDSEGNSHIFTRTNSYLEGNNAIQQKTEDLAQVQQAANNMNSGSTGKTGW